VGGVLLEGVESYDVLVVLGYLVALVSREGGEREEGRTGS
jgi:hypothetical protein